MMMRRLGVLFYGLIAYLIALAAVAAAIGFLANARLPTGLPAGIDQGAPRPVGVAVVVNTLLLAVFAVQHSVMARPGVKRRLTRLLPPSTERSTYVLASSLALIAVMAWWQPLPTIVWSVQTPALRAVLWALYLVGWITVLASTFMIDHLDLFGLRQVIARARERQHRAPGFRQTWLYRVVRHPIMVGFLIAFWATPDLSQGRLLFAGLGTAYILLGVTLEERDLVDYLGEDYRRYQQQVPRLLPTPTRTSGTPVGS